MNPIEVIAIVLLFIGLYVFSINHKMQQAELKVNEQASFFRDLFSERYYLLTDLVAVIRENEIKEKDAIADVINARAAASKSKDRFERIENDGKFTLAMVKLFKILEKYPIIEEDEWYVDIKKNYDRINDSVDKTGNAYNVSAKSYNDLVLKYPSKIIADFKKKKPVPMFITVEQAKESI